MPNPSPWLLLLLAIGAEVVGTSCLRLSAGMTRPLPTVVVLIAYTTAMLLLSRVVLSLPLGLTYALWSGIGIVAIVLVGIVAYRQIPGPQELVGIALITLGVVIVNLGGAAGHG
jgi:small multidrug resistance pump